MITKKVYKEFMRALNSEDPFSFYSILPSDLENATTSISSEKTAALVLSVLKDYPQVQEEPITDLIKKLIFSFNKPSSNPSYIELANKLSSLYIDLLSSNNRKIRMKVQLLNYCLREHIDAALEAPEDFHKTQAFYPWDFLVGDGFELVVDSGRSQNVHFLQKEQERSYKADLPTQVDFLDKTTISIGSYYSREHSFFCCKTGSITKKIYDEPVVLSFFFKGALFNIKRSGNIVDENNALFAKIPGSDINRARFFGANLYTMSWQDASKVHVYSMESKTHKDIMLDNVYIPNDLLKHEGMYYIVDKEQGSVFKYDESFKYLEKRHFFRKSQGGIADPVSIRYKDGKFLVLNWLNATVIRIREF